MQTFAERFQYLRKLTGLKQAEFASRINLSQGRLSDIEKGKNKPSADTLVSVAQQFSTDVNWLLMGTGTAPQSLEIFNDNLGLRGFSHLSNSENANEYIAEKELITKYKMLNKDNRKHIEKFICYLIFEQQDYSPIMKEFPNQEIT
ncbi:helix-turn-helix domain-containing protein [Paenibacillus sp. CAU 1782]